MTAIRLLFAGALFAALAACSPTLMTYAAGSLSRPPDHTVEHIPGLGERAVYTAMLGDGSGRDGTILFLTGSGCNSLAWHLREWFEDLPGNWRVIGLEKRGVAHRDIGLAGCSDVFRREIAYDTLDEDYTAFARWAGARYPDAPRRVVLGVSEGGGLAPRLAKTVPGFTHVVMVGSGAMPGRELLSRIAAAQGWRDRDEEIAKIESDPGDVGRTWRGHTPRYWASWLKWDAGRDLASINTPILMAHGTADRSVPVEAALHARDRLQRAGKRNLTLHLIEGGDHTLRTPDGTGRARFFKHLDHWLRESPIPRTG